VYVELFIPSGSAAFEDRLINEAPRASITISCTVNNNGSAMASPFTVDDRG